MTQKRPRKGWCIAADKPCPPACPVPSVDNFGNSYPGCALMRFKSLAEIEAMGKPEHPEDREVREKGEAYAREQGAAFGERYRAELLALVTTYADAEAEKKLGALREIFWSEEWLNPLRHKGRK